MTDGTGVDGPKDGVVCAPSLSLAGKHQDDMCDGSEASNFLET